MSTPQLSAPFYISRETIISTNITNTGQFTLNITAVIAQMNWIPRSTTTVTPLHMILPVGVQKQVSVTVAVPSDTIDADMQYRLGINTTQGLWFDVWHSNRARDYWYEAYYSLRASITNRLTNRTYNSPDAYAEGQQATNLLNEAETHPGTEQGYNLLLQADKHIDQAELDEANYDAAQANQPVYVLEAIGVILLLAIGLVLVRSRRHPEKKRKTVTREPKRRR